MKVLHRLHIWPLSIKNEGGPWTEKWPVSHTEEITCFVITYDSLQIITGSKDMSLKVWQINGGKLSQVRVLPKQITLSSIISVSAIAGIERVFSPVKYGKY